MTQDYTQERVERIRKIFSMICDPDDWKAPINRSITVEEMERLELSLEEIMESISFMTATEARCSYNLTSEGCWWHFRATGYRNGPAGP